MRAAPGTPASWRPRPGDLLALPLEDASVDVVVSVFGIIYTADPGAAFREVRRVLRPGGRVLFSAWKPAGPIDAMLRVFSGIVGRITDAPGRPSFAWSDPAVVGPPAAFLVRSPSVVHELAAS